MSELSVALVAVEDEGASVTTDKLDTSAGVDLEATEGANLGPKVKKKNSLKNRTTKI